MNQSSLNMRNQWSNQKVYDYITEGIILRSRTIWYEKGEKSNKYFLTLEKRNKSKTYIRSLVTSKGETSDPATILKNSKHFMGNCTGADPLKLRHSAVNISEINTLHLSSDEIDSCEGKLSMKECFEVLTAMYSNSPQVMMVSQKNFIWLSFRPWAVISYNVLITVFKKEKCHPLRNKL